MNEKQLILSCLKGEVEAFKEIVEMYKGKAMALALNMLGNREDAEDVCQETFIRIYSHLDKFDLQSPFQSWFYAILSNRCLDYLRKRRRFSRFLRKMKGVYSEVADFEPSFNPERQLLAQNILRDLSPKERIVLCLWANEGYSSVEMGRVLECSPVTARVLLFKARKKIKIKMEKENASLSNG